MSEAVHPRVMWTVLKHLRGVGSMTRWRNVAPILALVASVAGAQTVSPLRIGQITIERVDIYSPAEAKHGLLYQAANTIHIETRTSVIRSFLLFHEGDSYIPERLAESERNLRGLGFLRSVSITAGPPHDGVVDVIVRTQDGWSIEPGSQIGSRGGSGTYGISLTDANLLGFGRKLSIHFNKGIDRSGTAIDYRDPAFFRPYWQSRVTYARNSDGFRRRLSIGRPFYSFSARWSALMSFEDIRQDDRVFDGGLLAARFRHQHRQVLVAAGFAVAPNDKRALRLSGGFRSLRDGFSLGSGREATVLPDRRNFDYLFVRFDRVDNDFLKLNFVDNDLRDQDFNLGQQFSAEAGIAPRGSHGGYFRLAETAGRRMGARAFLLPSISFQSRTGQGLQNAILSASVRYVHPIATLHPQTFVARLMLNSGWNLDREVQFFADASDGLRGYRLHSFAGSRNLILNVEHRVFAGREFLQVISPGMVFFADAGVATNRPLLHFGSSLKSDVGIGIRIGLPRTPKNLLRLDVAYPLNRDPLGRRGIVVSFSSGQAF